MSNPTRRELLLDVGKGMFVAGLGAGVAADLGLAPAWAAEDPGRLTFGDLEPLVAFMQDTPPDKFLPRVVEKLRAGADLKQLVAAAALANARTFGGEDYVGFHTLMALPPAFHMASEEPDEKLRPLAVLKVLYRNSNRLKEKGNSKNEVLHPVEPGSLADGRPGGEQLRQAARKGDLAGAEKTFAAICRGGTPEDALDQLMMLVDDATEVHRTVLVSRSWELMDFVGRDRAHTLLRQSVHYCVNADKNANYAKYSQPVQELLPKLLDQHRLLSRSPGTRPADDTTLTKLADAIFSGTPPQAAEAAAQALAEGFSPAAVGEAVSLAANQLLLRDEGRPKAWAQPNKPVGSVHGDSVGVHACDSVLAWRAIARAGGRRTQVSSLILAAFQVARDRGARPEFLKWEPYPRPEHREKVAGLSSESLLKELAGAIREKDQTRAAAITDRIGKEKPDSSAEVFALLRAFSVSEDGALHAEKYYRTTTLEFAASRPAFRWRQAVALARVAASAYGYAAPGLDEARKLLKV